MSGNNDFTKAYSEQLSSIPLPQSIKDSYQIINCLKETESKSIYLLQDKQTSQQWILKQALGKYIPQLQKEYEIGQDIQNTRMLFVPRYISCFQEEQYCYLLRSFIDGDSLADYFDRKLYLSNLEIIEFMLSISRSISVLHAMEPPIIHRDLKPENFIIQKGTGHLYLIDFDTARRFQPDKSRDTTLIGTPSHAAPEQFGFSQSDVRTDIYALGKTFLYLAAGTTDEHNLSQYSLSKPFQKMIARCTDFTPDKRYSDVNQLIHSLKHYQMQLKFSKSYAKQIVTAAIFLALGAGFLSGSLREKQPLSDTDSLSVVSSTSEENAADRNSDNSDDEGNASQTNSDTSSTSTTAEAQNDLSDESNTAQDQNTSSESDTNDSAKDASLFEQSGAMECDFLEFQDLVNQIILDCYNSDSSSMAANCEKLVKALYEDEAVSQVTGTDYYGVTPASGEDFRAPIVQIRDNLAYRDQILKQKLGSYEHYADAIYSNIYNYLTPSVINTESCLYIHATASGEKSRVEYQGALSDIMNNIRMTIDWVDEQENASSSENNGN